MTCWRSGAGCSTSSSWLPAAAAVAAPMVQGPRRRRRSTTHSGASLETELPILPNHQPCLQLLAARSIGAEPAIITVCLYAPCCCSDYTARLESLGRLEGGLSASWRKPVLVHVSACLACLCSSLKSLLTCCAVLACSAADSLQLLRWRRTCRLQLSSWSRSSRCR